MNGYLELEASLHEIEPRIWRRFRVRADATFADLHAALQTLFRDDGILPTRS